MRRTSRGRRDFPVSLRDVAGMEGGTAGGAGAAVALLLFVFAWSLFAALVEVFCAPPPPAVVVTDEALFAVGLLLLGGSAGGVRG